MAGLAHYYSRYDHEHRHPGNRLLHGIGIPVIIAGMALGALTLWKVGLAMFAAGWLLLFLGHRLEGAIIPRSSRVRCTSLWARCGWGGN